MPTLKPTDFINQLRQFVREGSMERANVCDGVEMSQCFGRREMCDKILKSIESWALDYNTDQALNRHAWDDAFKAIETDIRKQFDNPDALLAHIDQIASKEAFQGNARLSLKAIQAFTGDYLHKREREIYKVQQQQAAF